MTSIIGESYLFCLNAADGTFLLRLSILILCLAAQVFNLLYLVLMILCSKLGRIDSKYSSEIDRLGEASGKVRISLLLLVANFRFN